MGKNKNNKVGTISAAYSRGTGWIDETVPGGAVTRHIGVGAAGAGVGAAAHHFGGVGPSMTTNMAVGGAVGLGASLLGDVALRDEATYVAKRIEVSNDGAKALSKRLGRLSAEEQAQAIELLAM